MNVPGRRAAIWAGLVPILSVNAAYLINAGHGSESCFPYLEGCQSVSQGLRSGPGLWLFKAAALPSVIAMVMAWRAAKTFLQQSSMGSAARRQWLVWLGWTGAVFFGVYAAWLGTEGDMYRWLRRYGVVFYFAGTGLAHLLMLATLRDRRWRSRVPLPGLSPYTAVVAATWLLGVLSAFKRKLIDDPALVDRVENALEWNFSLALALSFIALAPMLARDAKGWR